jgi:predicted TPR repeat methyltransferase
VYDFTRKIPPSSIQFYKERVYSFLQEKGETDSYKILSIGAGTGRIESSLASPKNSLFGIDISFKMLQEFHNKNYQGCYLVQADCLSIPFSKKFHLISAVNLIHLIQNYEKFYDEVVNTTDTLLIVYAYVDSSIHPYYLKFHQLLAEHQGEEERTDDVEGVDFYQLMINRGFEPEIYETKTEVEIINQEIYSSLQNRYFRSLWDIDDKIFERTLKDLTEYLSNNKDVTGDTFSTYSITKLFFYELD